MDEITDYTYLGCPFPIEIDNIWKSPANLNGLVRFGERQNPVSERVPSRFKCAILPAIRAGAPKNRLRGILKGLQPNWDEQREISKTIKQNDIDRCTIRKSRSVISLHPIVHKYMILNHWNFVGTT